MSNLTLKHLLDYLESPHQDSGARLVYGGRIWGCVGDDTAGQGGYGIVEEPCVLNGWMPPLTILPPRDNTIRRYYD